MKLIAIVAGLAFAAIVAGCVSMPGRSHAGSLAAPRDDEIAFATRAEADVDALAVTIGERNVGHPADLARAQDFVASRFTALGYEVTRERYRIEGIDAVSENIVVEKRGRIRPNEIVVVGAHLDSVEGTTGADDNATGVAALLGLAAALQKRAPERTVRFVAFANEEPPWFMTSSMGSLVAAEAWHERGDRMVEMISLESLGTFSDQDGSQQYPPPFSLLYPSRGDFVGFIGTVDATVLVRRCVASFRRADRLPSEGAALPGAIPGIDWSDHWSFEKVGVPSLMVTTTAPFRDPRYHTAGDTPDHVDFVRLGRAVAGLVVVVVDLARSDAT